VRNKILFGLAVFSLLNTAILAIVTKPGEHQPSPVSTIVHMDRTRAIDMCERYARGWSKNPSTVDFSRFLSMDVQEHSNGRTLVSTTFTAKNVLGLELKFDIRCLLDRNGMVDAEIGEAVR